eukprot:jgi/Hompol1/5322/HPOL_004332-RA
MTPLEIAASLLTVCMFLTNLHPLRQFAAAGSVGNASVVPLVATLLNCAFWLRYGLSLHQPAIVAVNAVGCAVAAFSIYVYCKFSEDRDSAERTVLMALASIFLVYLYAAASQTSESVEHIGLLSTLFSIIMFGSPLLSVAKVIQAKSAYGLISLSMASISLVVCLLWVLFGVQIKNSFVILPNVIGAALCLIQIIVFARYGGAPSRSSAHSPLPTSLRFE